MTAPVLRLMTYNLHGGRGLDGRRSFARQAAVIEDAKPDLVAVQEISERADASDLDELRDALGWRGRFVLSQLRPGSSYGHGLLTRGEVLEADALELPGHDHLETEPRTAARHLVAIEDHTLTVVSTHLALTTFERARQVQAIVDAGWIVPPCVLLGDLNCRPGATALAPLEARMVRVSGWRHRTWPAVLPLLPLDHVFVTPDIRVLGARTITRGAARYASDHAPFVAEVALP